MCVCVCVASREMKLIVCIWIILLSEEVIKTRLAMITGFGFCASTQKLQNERILVVMKC